MILTTPDSHSKSSMIGSLERLRLTARLSNQEWFDILDVPWSDYQDLKNGSTVINDKIVERAADFFKLQPDDLRLGRFDFARLAAKFECDVPIPERYSRAAFGRVRTSMTSIEFLEAAHGWRLRLDALQALGMTESALSDPFAPISMRFITDLCSYLQRRQFASHEFRAMGHHTYLANRHSVVGLLFSSLRNPAEIYESFFGESMELFERNCSYTITKLDSQNLTLEVLSDPDVAAETGVKHLGNTHVCELKAGMFAVLPRYLDLPLAHVVETECVHRGGTVCRFEIGFAETRPRLPRYSMPRSS